MTPIEKQQLARQNDTGLVASAIRLRAARGVAGRGQTAMARECGVSNTVLNNAERGLTYPNRAILQTFWRGYRIDFNFMINGDYAQLAPDVQEALFVALADAASEWDQREGSDRTPGGAKSVRGEKVTSRA